jgi:hypothetical protein
MFQNSMLERRIAVVALAAALFTPAELVIADSSLIEAQAGQAVAAPASIKTIQCSNLLRNSRFPLGLQSGWSVGGECSLGDDLTIDSDNKTIGPSRAASLRIQAKVAVSVWSEPFLVVEPTVPHHIVLSAKGTGTWKFSVINSRDAGKAPESTIQLSGDWKKVEVPFQPEAGKVVCAMKIEGNGTLWLDGLFAGPVRPNEVPHSQCEVALALSAGPNAFERIQFDDVEPTIEYAVSGGLLQGDELHTKALDLYGNSRELPVVSLSAEFVQRGSLKYCESTLGCFRVEAWVERSGAKIGPVNEIVVSRLHKPRFWKKDAPESYFGVHLVPTSQAIAQAKAIGINWVRCHGPALDLTGWASVEPTQGKWSFPDAKVKRLRDNKMIILGQLGSAPAWASYRTIGFNRRKRKHGARMSAA